MATKQHKKKMLAQIVNITSCHYFMTVMNANVFVNMLLNFLVYFTWGIAKPSLFELETNSYNTSGLMYAVWSRQTTTVPSPFVGIRKYNEDRPFNKPKCTLR